MATGHASSAVKLRKHYTRSIPPIVFPMDEFKSILHDASNCKAFVTVTCRVSINGAVRKRAALPSKFFAETLQNLNGFDQRLQQKTANINLAHDLADISPRQLFRQTMQNLTTFKAEDFL